MKILMAMDTSDALSMFSSILVSLNMPTPYKALNSADTLSSIKVHNPKLVFLDEELQPMPVAELITAIHDENPETLVIILCDRPSEDTIRDYSQLGINGILLKPFNRGSVQKLLKKSGWDSEKRRGVKVANAPSEEQKKITSILMRHLKDNQPLLLELDPHKPKYRGFIRTINDKDIIFESIEPADADQLLKHNLGFRVIMFDNGDSVEFFSILKETKKVGKGEIYSIPRPNAQDVCFVERRTSNRVRLEHDTPCPLSFYFKGKHITDARVYDIGEGTIGIEVPGFNLEKIMARDDILEQVVFKMPDDTNYECEIKVIRVSYITDRKLSIIGGSYQGLTEASLQDLSHMVATLTARNMKQMQNYLQENRAANG